MWLFLCSINMCLLWLSFPIGHKKLFPWELEFQPVNVVHCCGNFCSWRNAWCSHRSSYCWFPGQVIYPCICFCVVVKLVMQRTMTGDISEFQPVILRVKWTFFLVQLEKLSLLELIVQLRKMQESHWWLEV